MSKLHWTQTPEGKARMAEVQKKAWKTKRAKQIVRAAKSTPKKKKEKKATSLVINGWRITLGKDEVRIEND